MARVKVNRARSIYVTDAAWKGISVIAKRNEKSTSAYIHELINDDIDRKVRNQAIAKKVVKR